MFFFTPRYLKQAKLLHKGVTRFIDYKRDEWDKFLATVTAWDHETYMDCLP